MERSPFSAKNQTLQDLTELYFSYDVGIISSYSIRIKRSGQTYTFDFKNGKFWI